MNNQNLKTYFGELLSKAGVSLNGDNPWDIQIHNQDFYARILKQGSLGLGESYVEQWWDCERLDQFFDRVISANLDNKIKNDYLTLLKLLFLNFFNPQTKKRALIVAQQHYDLGNDLFQAMLDKNMNYTCGYWKNATDLDGAQRDKLELTCQKLMLKPGMRILDIGCGFGAFAKYAAENYGVDVVGVTISRQQYDYAQKNCAYLPVKIMFQDYRDIQGEFDRVVSLGMFEHVGLKNYLTYMQKVHQCLKKEGLFLLHTIGHNFSTHTIDPWIAKYIFPNSNLPSIVQIGKASEKLFVLEDWHNFGADYNKTLLAWHDNFNQHWDELKNKYDDRFYRMWRYYLLSCAGTFSSRYNQLWQIVFSKHGFPGGYQAPRL